MNKFEQIKSNPWLAQVFALFGSLLYLIQTWTYIHTQSSVLDEGNYLVKGLLFARGQYNIYQDYGFWSNHMPLSFYIPGWVQQLFGPGLRTGRYLAFGLGIFFLLGIWLIALRWGGRWWAAFSVWAIALNPVVLKIYSTMTSQVLIASMFVWALFFTLAEKRKLWQLILGSAIAGLLLLTRLNLAPVLPLFCLYIFWQHGKRAGIWSLIVIIGVILIGHAIFWPGILRMWATWIPIKIVPFLEPFQSPQGAHWWNPDVDLFGRIVSFFLAVKYHFLAFVGVIGTLVLWPKKSYWKSLDHCRASVFLVITFMVLFFAHLWVTIGAGINSNETYSSSYCVFCFPVYMAFFSFLGIILLVVAFPSWQREVSRWRLLAIIILLLLISVGIGITMRSFVDDGLLSYRTIRMIMSWEVPRFDSLRIQPGTIELWGLIQNLTGLEKPEVHLLIRKNLKTGIVIFSGIIFWMGVLVAGLLAAFALKKSEYSPTLSWGFLSLNLFILFGLVLSPFKILGGGYQDYDCGIDVLESYDAVGHHLDENIPPGATIFWRGGLSPVGLLYLEDFQIFPPLLNGVYSFRESGDTDELLKYGFWNDTLARQWAQEANVILIDESRFGNGPAEREVSSGHFFERTPTQPQELCRPDSYIHIYVRKP